MSCFIYDQDFHYDKGLDLKHPLYKNLIGLQLTNKGIDFIPQCNTYCARLKLYNTNFNSSASDVLATTTLLTYISNFKKVQGINSETGAHYENFYIEYHSLFSLLVEHRKVGSYQLGLARKLKLHAFALFKSSNY